MGCSVELFEGSVWLTDDSGRPHELQPDDAVTVVVDALAGDPDPDVSLLAAAALLARAQQIVIEGRLRLGVTDTRPAQVVWQAAPDDDDDAALSGYLPLLTDDGRPPSFSDAQAGLQLAADVADTAAAALPLPAALAQRPAPSAHSVAQWNDRVRLRRRTGARLQVRLVPPADDGDAWSAEALLVRGGDEFAVADRMHWRREIDALAGSFDELDLMELADLEIAAARSVVRLARLYRDGFQVLSDNQLLNLLDRVDSFAAIGMDLVVPKGLGRRPPRLRTTATVSGSPAGVTSGDLTLSVEAFLDDRPLTAEQLEQLADARTPFVQLGSDWVRVPPDAAAARRLFDRAGAVAATDLLDDEFDGFDIDAESVQGWVGRALRGEVVLCEAVPATVPSGVRAELRHYQRDGLTWLQWCEANGVGGILADDMGLGKTLQLLTLIQSDFRGPTLVVAPTTLLENWRREAARFTPDLRVAIHHGTDRSADAGFADVDIVVTTYQLVTRDRNLRETAWHRVVLDEAQAIKNPSSRAAQACRSLRADRRFAVTGTPIENSVADLWSLLAFAQPGLLGSFAKFRRRYLSTAGRTDPDRLTRLRAVVSPFLLRRTKRDKSVLPDLPDKIEQRRDCGLTRPQVAVYESVVAELEKQAKAASGTKRRGIILAALTRLKQACIHPQLALGTAGEGLHESSGKLLELSQLITEAVAEGDALIVFTQYASFLPPLRQWLMQQTGLEVLRLDGSMTPARRSDAVDRFSDPGGPPVLLASLKAGGTGLNLVRANHVIHLDRWWNPAVEDQGSDRAWRMGQQQTVFVHTLVCPGTVEDRIATVLTDKRATAAAVVPGDPGPAVTELDDADLGELVALVREESVLLRSS